MNSTQPVIKTWSKLVRDDIPTTLANKGILSHIHIVKSKSEILQLLVEKGKEELSEVKQAINNMNDLTPTQELIEEIADLYEVKRSMKIVYRKMKNIYKTAEQNKEILGRISELKNVVFNTLKKYKINVKHMIDVANKKRTERGAFVKWVFLHQTIELSPHA